MTKEEIKANELIERFKPHVNDDWFSVEENAIICAIICVDELINAFEEFSIQEHGAIHIDYGHGFWQSVKQILESK